MTNEIFQCGFSLIIYFAMIMEKVENIDKNFGKLRN